MKRKSLLPPTYLLGAMALMAGLHFAWPVAKLVPSPWRYLGLVPLALGVLLNLWCDRLFHHARTTVDPFEQPSSLITGGPFRISRHPMYLGMVTLLAGLGVLLGTLSAFLVVPVFALAMDRVFIRTEEQAMEKTFGEEYREYRKRVRRWI